MIGFGGGGYRSEQGNSSIDLIPTTLLERHQRNNLLSRLPGMFVSGTEVSVVDNGKRTSTKGRGIDIPSQDEGSFVLYVRSTFGNDLRVKVEGQISVSLTSGADERDNNTLLISSSKQTITMSTRPGSDYTLKEFIL